MHTKRYKKEKKNNNRTVGIAWKKTKNIFNALFCCYVQLLLYVTSVIDVHNADCTTKYSAIEMLNINNFMYTNFVLLHATRLNTHFTKRRLWSTDL